MRVLLLICVLLAARPAGAGTAVCAVDLEAGTFAWTAPDGRALGPLRLEDARGRFAELARALARGEGADALRARLGQAILAPVWPEISGADRWRIVRLDEQRLPEALGAFATLQLPDGRAALEHASVALDWVEPRRSPPEETRSGALLLSAPFAAGVDPARDDPDTLRQALSKAARHVRLIPRNETGAATLRSALEDVRPAVWWFRGEAAILAEWMDAFVELPSLIVWTLPSRSSLDVPALTPATFAGASGPPACVVVASHAIDETALAPVARTLADGLARGLDCGTALREAQLAALDQGLPVAASLVLVGDPATTAPLARAPWFRRLFR
jgi:hypothetical protein